MQVTSRSWKKRRLLGPAFSTANLPLPSAVQSRYRRHKGSQSHCPCRFSTAFRPLAARKVHHPKNLDNDEQHSLFENRASRSRDAYERESSAAHAEVSAGLATLANRRKLPTDHDYADSTLEYQADQSSLKLAPTTAGSALNKRQKQRKQQKQPHRCAAIGRVTPLQAGLWFRNSCASIEAPSPGAVSKRNLPPDRSILSRMPLSPKW